MLAEEKRRAVKRRPQMRGPWGLPPPSICCCVCVWGKVAPRHDWVSGLCLHQLRSRIPPNKKKFKFQAQMGKCRAPESCKQRYGLGSLFTARTNRDGACRFGRASEPSTCLSDLVPIGGTRDRRSLPWESVGCEVACAASTCRGRDLLSRARAYEAHPFSARRAKYPHTSSASLSCGLGLRRPCHAL